ncbi:Condensin-2 complex subunit G2 [Dichanthelium oligosanthes]|uniref:Condensin-2 complex subunit G2 n=1 Tax=Dichanthelium oligosanthes TaxID=888268 RepID=A0A1E5VDN6_9POAL|nr:Condensin-2 complex subunit G2 [Dichanthelium oligosanthes]
MPPARRRPRRSATPADADDSVPSSAADLLALAATLVPAAATTALKPPPQLKQLVHSLRASHPLLLSLPQALALALALAPPSDTDNASASGSDAPSPPTPRAAAVLLHLLLTHPSHPPRWDDLIRPLELLHSRLALLATADPPLAGLAAACFELAWRADAPGREALVAQTLPYLVALALTSGSSARPVLRRLFALRDALALLDYDDDQSIYDFKMLLLRCFVSPLFLKAEEGRKFLALVLGVSEGIAREGLELIRAQVGITGAKRAAVVAYGEVVFRAWKDGGWVRAEVGEAFLQGMVEGAVHAGSKEVAKAARKILWVFVEHRAVAGVEKLVFRLAEPVLFRSLQVANSNVRHNALHLLLDLFPLEDPDVTKDVNDPLIEKQFFLIDKLLMDDCSEIRTVAVEGICRILNQYWEIVPAPTISKFLSKIVDDMSKDSCNEVRLSTLNGLVYLLDNPQSHEILKVLLPKLSNMISDTALSVRAAAVDLLLAIRDLRSFQYNKVVGLGTLLSSLENDHPRIAQKITKLLIPSYFPSKLSPKEACARCIALIKRSPTAGARFCEFALSEGSPPRSIIELVKFSITLALSRTGLNSDQIDGLVIASVNLIKSLAEERSSLTALQEFFANAKLRLVLQTVVSEGARAALLSIAPAVLPDDLSVLHEECMDIVLNAARISKQEECQEAALAAHKLIVLSGWSDELFEALTNILQSKASAFAEIYGLEPPCPIASSRRKRGKSLKKIPARDHVVGKGLCKSKVGSEELAVAAGAAWQINEIVKAEDLRDAFLQSSYSEIAFSSLKVVSQVYVEQCLYLDSLDLAPVLAYLSLSTYNALPDVDQTGNCSESSTANQSLDHLLNCFSKLLNAPVKNPPSKSNQNGKASRSKDQQKGASEGNTVKGTVNAIMLGTSILKFIADTTNLKLVNDDKIRCLKFASSYTKYAVSSIKKHQEQSSSFKGDDLKDALVLIRSSFTYAAKLLHLVLSSSTEESSPPEEAFFLANDLLDLVPSVESFAGSRFALSIVSALKQWLPVLILGLVCRWLIGPQNEMAANVFHFGDSCLPLWVAAVAKNELDSKEPGQDEQSEQAAEGEDSSSSRKLAEMMAILLKKGSPRIIDCVGGLLMSTLQLMLQRSEYDIVLGLTRFVCARLLGSNTLALEKLQITCESLRENFFEIDKCVRVELVDDDDSRQQLESAKALIRSVITDV